MLSSERCVLYSCYLTTFIHMLIVVCTGSLHIARQHPGSEILRSCRGKRYTTTTGIRYCATTSDVDDYFISSLNEVLGDVESYLSIDPHERLRSRYRMLPCQNQYILHDRSFQRAQVDCLFLSCSPCDTCVDSINCGCPSQTDSIVSSCEL